MREATEYSFIHSVVCLFCITLFVLWIYLVVDLLLINSIYGLIGQLIKVGQYWRFFSEPGYYEIGFRNHFKLEN